MCFANRKYMEVLYLSGLSFGWNAPRVVDFGQGRHLPRSSQLDMDAAVLYTLGKPPQFARFDEPVAGEGELLVNVLAASLKPVDRQLAAGSHFASPRQLPCVCGTDGVGRLNDLSRLRRSPPQCAGAELHRIPDEKSVARCRGRACRP